MWNTAVAALHAFTLLLIAGGYVIAVTMPLGLTPDAWATLMGAMVAGAMTLGGGYLAYIAGIKQADAVEKIEKRKASLHSAAVKTHIWESAIQNNSVIDKDFVDFHLSVLKDCTNPENSIEIIHSSIDFFIENIMPFPIKIKIEDRARVEEKIQACISIHNNCVNNIKLYLQNIKQMNFHLIEQSENPNQHRDFLSRKIIEYIDIVEQNYNISRKYISHIADMTSDDMRNYIAEV